MRLYRMQRHTRCHRCQGFRWSSRAQVRRWLAQERVKALQAGAHDDVDCRALLRTLLSLLGQDAGLCSSCSSGDAMKALGADRPRRRRRAA